METTDRPWMVALERQFSALRMSVDLRDQLGVLDPPNNSPNLWAACHDAALFLPHSQTYAWTAETSGAVLLASRTVPGDSEINDSLLLNGTAWFWSFSPCLPIPRVHHADAELTKQLEIDESGLAALALGRWQNGKLVLIPFYLVKAAIPTPLSISVAKPGTRIWQIAEDAKTEKSIAQCLVLWRFVVAGCAWMNQRILSMSSGPIQRHRRKQIAREHKAPIPSDVKVIELRRVESTPRINDGTTGDPVEWSCRWVVNGHWRNQPYKDERRLIFISPYMKGPTDKPLRIPAYTVYQVDR